MVHIQVPMGVSICVTVGDNPLYKSHLENTNGADNEGSENVALVKINKWYFCVWG